MGACLSHHAHQPTTSAHLRLLGNSRFVKTLVLDLDDVLVHSSWTRQRGWRSFKRPGVEDFLKHMAQYYELVLYTDQNSTYADPILDRIDPQRNISYRLYKNSTHYIDGKHVRDLSKLNRDLGRVLLLSCNPDAYSLQPENTIKVLSVAVGGVLKKVVAGFA